MDVDCDGVNSDCKVWLLYTPTMAVRFDMLTR